jgi:hypothetical protein
MVDSPYTKTISVPEHTGTQKELCAQDVAR